MVIPDRRTSKKTQAKAVCVTIILALILALVVPYMGTVNPTPINLGEYRIKITFDNGASSTNLMSFPVYININTSMTDFWSHVNSNHSDLRFIDNDGASELYFEIEHWDYDGKQADVWVNVTQIDASSTSDFIYLYYGNQSATPSPYESKTRVWDSAYQGVWHLSEQSGAIYDSTGNAYTGITSGTPTYGDPGKIAGAMTFDGMGDFLTYGNILDTLSTGKNVTMEAWFQLDNFSTEQVILGKNNGSSLPLGLQVFPGINQIIIYGGDTTDGYRSHILSWVPDTQWHYLVGIINGTTIQGYMDGTDMGTSVRNNDFILSNTADVIAGWQNITGYNRDFNGTLDELRISSASRSHDWVSASYRTMNNTFVTFGTEEDVTPPDITDILDMPDPQITGGTVNITATVTDNEQLNRVKVHISYPDTSLVNMTMSPIPSSNIFYYNVSYIPTGIYSYYIWANDTSGNSIRSLDYTFIIQEPVPGLTISKAVRNDTAWITNITTFLGEHLEFNITVTNTGTATLTGIEITDTFPSFLQYNFDATLLPATASQHYITWNMASLTVGDKTTITYSTSVIATGTGNNNATVHSSDGANDTDTVKITSILDGDDTTPPVINIEKPSRYLYIADRAIMPTLWKPIILGGITIEAIAMDDESGIDRVEFYINNDLQTTDESWPYEWLWDDLSFGLYTLKAKAYNTVGNSDVESISLYIINF